MNLTQRAQEVFYKDIYATRQTGVIIKDVSIDQAVCTLVVNDSHRNAKGAVMGGVLYTLADFAFAIAANSPQIHDTAVGQEVILEWVSTAATIHYLATSRGDLLTATSHCIKRGHTQCLFQTEITDSTGRQVALVTTSGTRVGSATFASKSE